MGTDAQIAGDYGATGSSTSAHSLSNENDSGLTNRAKQQDDAGRLTSQGQNAAEAVAEGYRPLLELLTVFLWMMMMPIAVVCHLITLLCPLLWPYWLYIQFDNTPSQGGRVRMGVRKLPIWSFFRSYFPVNLYSETELVPATKSDGKPKNYFLIAHPHGIMPLGLWCNIATEANDISSHLPGIDFRICTLSSNFKIPFIRELVMGLGMVPVSEDSIRWYLTHESPSHAKRNIAIVDVVGGSAESLDQEPGTSRLTLERRTGYLRIAISTSSHLVPVFTFGENNLFRQKRNPDGSLLRKFQEAGKKIAGMSPTLFWGRSVVSPNSWGFVPYKRKASTVIGRPIDVEDIVGRVESDEEITEEMMDKLKTAYIRELRALYDRWKDELDPDRDEDMQIVG